MTDDDRDGTPQRALARIAQVLGVPVSQFYEPTEVSAPLLCTDPREIELLRLFRTIRTDEDRQRCLDLMRQTASGT